MSPKRAVVGSAVDGRVVELVAHEGQRVAAGEPLVLLLTETIKLELLAAEAELELCKQQLAELANGSRPEELVQAKAKMLGSKAQMEYAQGRRNRAEELRQSQAISEEQLDEALSIATAAEQSFYDAQAAYELVKEGPRPERVSQARAQVAMQDAKVRQIEDRIKKYTIISRFNGYVTAEYAEEGAWVKTGDPVMEVIGLDEVEVQAFVTEQHVPFVKPGSTVRVEVPALPDEVFSGVVETVVPQADTKARTFPVKVLVQNVIAPDGPLLKSGMYARVELPTGPRQVAVLVPKDALVLGGPQPIVYAVETTDDKSGKATPLPVQLGVATGNLIQVKGPLQAGQWVVVEGNERLRPGQDVVITGIQQPLLTAAAQEQAKP